jgi:hypothetical protein
MPITLTSDDWAESMTTVIDIEAYRKMHGMRFGASSGYPALEYTGLP